MGNDFYMKSCFSWYISFVAYFNSTRSGWVSKKLKIFRMIELIIGIIGIVLPSILYFMDILSGAESGILTVVGVVIFNHAADLSNKDKTEKKI